MNQTIAKHIDSVLSHLYINPLEKCNLHCKICYTRKTAPILSEEQILSFIERYHKEKKVEIVTFCGGEVFTVPYFTHLANTLIHQGIFVQIITNASINTLDEILVPNSVNLIISIDGLEAYHDKNRGIGSFQTCIRYLQYAQRKGFHYEIFSIVTKQNMQDIDAFERYIQKNIGLTDITYHPRKPLNYLSQHPLSNITGHIEGFDFLDTNEMKLIMKTKKTFPPRELGCYQISVASNGTIYGCCEGYRSIGSIDDPIPQLFARLRKNIGGPCLGCSQTEFMCGIRDIIKII